MLPKTNSKCSFVELLRGNNDKTNHQRNIQILLTELFTTTNSLALPIS